MRRIAILLTLVAAVAGLHGCAADAPTNPGTGGGGGGTALTIQLITNDSNPKAGTCTLIEAVVAVNGTPVPDGTAVNFSSDFGTFSQNGQPLVSVVTQSGVAVTALCGPGAGLAKVHATATSAGNTGSANLSIVFQPSASTLPFVSSCSPSFGPKEGGTTLTLNGGRFFGSPSTTRAQFTVNGTSRDGIVQSVTANQIVLQTPGFPEFSAPQLLAQITLSLGTNSPQPVVLALPTCFSYGASESGQPTIASLLPAGGTSEGGTRVTIVGSGFSTTSGVQVFFGTAEAQVISVSFSQVVVLSPLQVGTPTAVGVTVRNIGSGLVSNAVNYNYTEPVVITGFNNNVQPLGGPFTPMTIFGRGFQAPIAVSLAGFGAIIQSVTATEIVVIPGPAIPEGCSNIEGEIGITNLNTGSGTTGGSFTYVVSKPAIASVIPSNSCPGGAPCTPGGGFGNIPATINGANFPLNPASVDVKFGNQTAFVNSTSFSAIGVTVPATTKAAPACTGSNVAGTPQLVDTVDVEVTDRVTSCSIKAVGAFQYLVPCTVPPPPTPTP
jgi:large repetitive protein